MSSSEALRKYGYVLGLLAITLSIALGWFLLDGHIGFNLADEGFLWYGSEALSRGEVPMRDFESYDPGRYVWTAAWSALLGHSLIALRLSCVFFQCLGVLAGLLTMRRVSRNWFFLFAVGLLLSSWMHPRYKLFEQSISLMAVYAAVLLLENPTPRRHWYVGVFGGLCAFFGRNHGAYHLFAFGLLIAIAAWRSSWRDGFQRYFLWGCGLFAGYLPQLLMFAFIPGFFRAFTPYVQAIASNGTNLSRPVPWPWLIPTSQSAYTFASNFALGCFFVALPAFLVFGCLRLWQLRRNNAAPSRLLLATACVTLPYTHYAFSRPDVVHLAHAGAVAVLGLLAVAFTLPRAGQRLAYLSLPLLLVATVLSQLSQIGFAFQCLAPKQAKFEVSLGDERMLLSSFHAHALLSAQYIVKHLAKPDEGVFFAPHTPGLYPFTGRRSPTNQIYFVFPASAEADQHLVDELKEANVQWAMIEDYALDGRDDLRFQHTNPLVYAYLRKNFDSVNLETLPGDIVLLHRAPTPKT